MISPRRLKALVRKETLQIVRDPSSILIAFILPIILLLIFGYGVSLDSNNLRIGIVVEESSPDTTDFLNAFLGSRYFEPTSGNSMAAMEALLEKEEIRGIVRLQSDFASQLARPSGVAPIQVITDGSQPQLAAFLEAYVRGAWAHWRELRSIGSGVSAEQAPISVEPRIWFNPSALSRNVLIPGSIAIIMTVVGALLTALVVAREWERGTMEALLASPVTRLELLLGKVIPYFGLGLISFTGCVVFAVFILRISFEGSVFALYLTASLFLLGALGLGLAISAGAKNQFLASQAALNAAFLPAFILSGFIFEIQSMPHWIQAITRVIPARYLVSSLQTIFLAGDLWPVLLPKLGVLALIAILLLGLTARLLKRRLD